MCSYQEVTKKGEVWELCWKSMKMKTIQKRIRVVDAFSKWFGEYVKRHQMHGSASVLFFILLQLLPTFPNYLFHISFLIRIHSAIVFLLAS